MFVLEVTPLRAIPLPHPQTLTYYSPEDIVRGGLVEIPIRRSKIPAVVLTSKPLGSEKMSLRSATFSVRPISGIINRLPVVDERTIRFAEWIHRAYWVSFGHALRLTVPARHLSRRTIPPLISEQSAQTPNTAYFTGIERWNEYRKEIHKTLEEGRSVLFLVPRHEDTDAILKTRGYIFPSSPVYWASNIPAGAARRIWEDMRQGRVRSVIGTRAAIFAPLHALGLIIIENEADEQHRSWGERPYYDVRKLARYRAESEGADVMFGEEREPSIQEWFYAGTPEVPYDDIDMGHKPSRLVIDMRAEAAAGNASPLSSELAARISGLARDRQMILFLNRRGYATSLFCRDCGYVALCANCESPVVYHLSFAKTQGKKARLVCHHCGTQAQFPEKCPNCLSHRLDLAGTGIQKVVAEVRRLNPHARILRADSDTLPTSRIQKKCADAWAKKMFDIAIGTSLLLELGLSGAETVGIVSVDGLLHLPDFQQGERVWHTIHKLVRLARDSEIVQTFVPENPVFVSYSARRRDFYATELASRKSLRYPPFGGLVKLEFIHRDAKRGYLEAKKLHQWLAGGIRDFPQTFSAELLGPAPAFIPKERGMYRWQLLLKFPFTSPLPPRELLRMRNHLLRYAAPPWSVEVDPVTLL